MIFSGTNHCYTVYFAKGATIVVIHFQKTTKKCGKYKTFVDPFTGNPLLYINTTITVNHYS